MHYCSGEHTVRFTDRQSERLVDAQPPGRPRLSNTDVDGASPFLGRRTDTAEWRDAEAGGGPHPPHDRLEGEGSDEGVRVRGNGASESANPRHDESDGGRRPRSGRIGGASGDPGVGRRSTPTGRDRPALTRHESPQSTTGHTTNVTIVNNNSGQYIKLTLDGFVNWIYSSIRLYPSCVTVVNGIWVLINGYLHRISQAILGLWDQQVTSKQSPWIFPFHNIKGHGSKIWEQSMG